MIAAPLVTGDRARLVVRGVDADSCRLLLEALLADERLGETLVPATVGTRPHSNEFGEITAVQEFLVAVAAGITVETLAAGFRAALGRLHGRRPEIASPQTTQVEVTTSAPGLVEVTVVMSAEAVDAGAARDN